MFANVDYIINLFKENDVFLSKKIVNMLSKTLIFFVKLIG